VEAGIEARGGEASSAFYGAFRLVPSIAYSLLAKHRLGRFEEDGSFVADPRPWWPLKLLLAALHEVNTMVGSAKTVEIGKLIEGVVEWPPSVTNIRTMMASIDIAYHLNHRKHGQIMFDLATGLMLEGIGHYVFGGEQHGNFCTITTDAPYPCDCDRGILTGFARRFERQSFVEHGPGPCRKNGDATCTYHISW